MEATVRYGARDVRFEDRPEPKISSQQTPSFGCRSRAFAGRTCGRTAAFNRCHHRRRWVTSTCGFVEDVGRDVTSVRPGEFVIGSFFASDNTCPHCRHGYRRSSSAWARRSR